MPNNLTNPDFWTEGWEKVSLPSKFRYVGFAQGVIVQKINQYLPQAPKTFLEIGGCPGRWAHHFFTRYKSVCDVMDYTDKNIRITRKNYELLDIPGEVFFGDITKGVDTYEKKDQYDCVLSDGLVEHFIDSADVFAHHAELVKPGGHLIVSVPNIKETFFYDYLARLDQVSYVGYRHVSCEELVTLAKKNNLDVLFCGYVGVMNLGLINTGSFWRIFHYMYILMYLASEFVLKFFRPIKETRTFSPYIYLIAQKKV